jgi:hypothetical protein
MKNFLRTGLILPSIVLVLFAAAPAAAQVNDHLTFSTSFPFTVAGVQLPAGRYSVAQVPGAPSVFELTGVGGKFVLMEVDETVNPLAANRNQIDNELVFKKLEDGTYALSEIWDRQDQSGVQVAWLNFRHVTAVAEPAPLTIKH